MIYFPHISRLTMSAEKGGSFASGRKSPVERDLGENLLVLELLKMSGRPGISRHPSQSNLLATPHKKWQIHRRIDPLACSIPSSIGTAQCLGSTPL
jgi:hypothetical protein